MQDYIITYTKTRFTPLDPKNEDIKIEDIAHALSLMTRANGHFPEFFSVAQHCILCALEAMASGCTNREALACLLHDGSEAYLADITRPVKKSLVNYLNIEKVLQSAIYEKYLDGGLTKQEEETVKRIDDALLYYEFEHYMGERLFQNKPLLVSNPRFETSPFSIVESRYLELFHRLMQRDL